jgi:dUTPase
MHTEDFLIKQRMLQELVNGSATWNNDPEKRAASFRENFLALQSELFEAMDEIGWKPWATSRHVNREAFISELADAYHFFLNLLLLVGCSGDEFDVAWKKKNAKNFQRYKEPGSYDGISTKCIMCARDVNDAGVECFLPVAGGTTGFCCPNGARYTWVQYQEAVLKAMVI